MWMLALRRGGRVRGWLGALVLLTVLGGAAPMAGQPQPPARQDEFVPVDQLPPQEQVPAAPLLIAAYALAWLAILVYMWSIWRRLGRVERDMADVARRIDAASPR